MLRKLLIFTGCVLPLVLTNCVYCDTLEIYDNLKPCYRGNFTQQWAAHTLQILLELIRKIENAFPTSLDIRMLSVNIIHQLRIDGIERAPGIKETEYITPYRPNGIMTPKFQLLLKLISNVPGNYNFDEILTQSELCYLHRLVSSSVDPYTRGDESLKCLPVEVRTSDHVTDWIPRQKINVYDNERIFIVSDKISRCPIERGVIRTYEYGSLSPGVVIASIAAALQPQSVPIKKFFPSIDVVTDEYENFDALDKRDTDSNLSKIYENYQTIDNTYAAHLAGDLAEVCIYQVPYYRTNVSVGTYGYWNDAEYPTVRYISEDQYLNWAMTDAEILAGLDGLHLSNNIRNWVNKVHRMKLSQILEMFYSSRGIPTYAIENDLHNKKSNVYGNFVARRAIEENKLKKYLDYTFPESNVLLRGGFEDHFDTIRYIDTGCERKYVLSHIQKDKLKEQTFLIAQILQFSTANVALDDELIKSACNAAVDKFFERATKLINQLPECNKITGNYKRPAIDLTVIIDGSRSKYENLKFISYLSEIMDISSYGSKLSVIHGGTGKYLVKQTNSIMTAFEQLNSYKGQYPTTLSLTDSFETIIYSHIAQEKNEQNMGNIGRLSQVILIVSQSQRILQNDFENAKSMLEGSLQQFPDMYFLFLTNDEKTFRDLTRDVAKMPFNDKDKYQIIHSDNINPITFSKAISRALLPIPKRLIIPPCLNTKLDESIEQFNPTQYEFEDYLSPNQPMFYKIGGNELIKLSELRVQFMDVGYGDFTVCKSRKLQEYQCQSTTIKNDIWFNFTNPCDQNYPELCSSLNFRIEMDTSKMKCSENDCRYPDQVRFIIRPMNYDCISADGDVLHSKILLLTIICIFFVKFLV